MSGACGSTQAARALGQHPPGSLVTTNIFFCRTHFISSWRSGGPLSTSSTTVVAAAGPTASTPKGPAVDISSFSGGRCRTCLQHPQGARCRRLQHRWWPLPKILTATPRGLPSMSPASVVVVARPADSTSPGGPPSTSPASVVAATENPDSTPQGATVDVCLTLVPAARIFFVTPTKGSPR
jgi:hypothetical protein